MRLVTSAKYLIGLAAAGSAVVVLGGSALAAEDVAGLGNSQPINVSISQDAQSNPTERLVNEDGAVSEGASSADKASKTEESQSPASSSQAQASASQVPATNAKLTEAQQSSKPTGNVLAGKGLVTSILPAATPKNPEVTSASSQPVVAPSQEAAVTPAEVTPVAPKAAQISSLADDRVVVFQSRLLPLQPIITSHASLMNDDLAAAVPSAPATKDMPVPANSTGLLSSLTASLATTIVPSFLIAQIPLWTSVPAWPTYAGLTLTLGLFVFTFGLWLRRGGFQFAARSDVATSGSSFATPFLMGYVPAAPKIHNPFLVVAETKIYLPMFPNAMRKEEVI